MCPIQAENLTSEPERESASLQKPEGGARADHVRRYQPRPRGQLNPDPPPQSEQREADSDESNLPGLHADVEEEQRARNVTAGQADLRQRTGKAEPVQQSEREGDNPGLPIGEPPSAPLVLYELHGHEHDAQRHDRFDRVRRHLDHAQRGHRKRDAVRHGEGSDRPQEPPGTIDDQEQAEHEQ